MKLLSVVSSMDPTNGGIAQGIRNNVPHWEEHGIASSIVTSDSLHHAFVKQDKIIALGPGKTGWGYSKNLKEWMYEHIGSYTVIVVHGLWLYNNYVLYKAMEQLKKDGKAVPKLYVMPHGMLDPYFQKSKTRILKAIRNVFYWHLIEKKIIKAADAVLFTCEEEMQLAATTFSGYKPKKTFTIGFGIDTPPEFTPQQTIAFQALCPALQNKKYLLFLGRVDPKKGVDLLVDAYAIIKRKFWAESKQLPMLVIAGPGGDSPYGKELLLKVQNDPSLANSIFFTGMLQGDAKWGAFYGCEAFVLPSHQENFGIAVVEAMACSKAVLISNKVNIWREIELGKAGIIENDDLEGAFNFFTKWVSLNDTEKQEMGLYAYKTYLTKFTAKATSAKFIEVLKMA